MKPPRPSYIKAGIVYLAYAVGLRGYCFPCDRLRWRWTHRNCCARQREIGRLIAALMGGRLAYDDKREDRP